MSVQPSGTAAEGMTKEIVEYASGRGLIISQDALALLCKSGNYRELMDRLESAGKSLVSAADVEELIVKSKTKVSSVVKEVVVKRSTFTAAAKEVDADLRIMEEYDITNKSCSEGKVGNFLQLFRDKFEFLSALLEKRSALKPKKISALRKAAAKEKIDLIGMVSEKWVTKNGNLALRIEDIDDECIAIVRRDNSPMARDAENIVNDDVIAIKGSKISEGLIAVQEFFWPDLEQAPLAEGGRDLNLALISDAHVGSKLFLEKEFGDFIKWLSGGSQLTGEKERQEIGKIKYLVIAGDNIDGIGVYPDQYDELVIKDVYEQYRRFSSFIEQVPDYMEVIICPGQHDAVRRADPQPAIAKEYLPELSSRGNISLVGSPSWFEVEGLKSLIYHGASLHDLYRSVKNLNPKEPERAITEVLRRRDLMVSYGMYQPYIPEKKDYLLVRERPDLYFGGDMHHYGVGSYRGCTIMNSSTWQLQTDFQKEQGHVPTPGVALTINLGSRKIFRKNFYSEGDG
jgi:DNA polymerase II small subunit